MSSDPSAPTPSAAVEPCKHKFVDSNHCLLCGISVIELFKGEVATLTALLSAAQRDLDTVTKEKDVLKRERDAARYITGADTDSLKAALAASEARVQALERQLEQDDEPVRRHKPTGDVCPRCRRPLLKDALARGVEFCRCLRA